MVKNKEIIKLKKEGYSQREIAKKPELKVSNTEVVRPPAVEGNIQAIDPVSAVKTNTDIGRSNESSDKKLSVSIPKKSKKYKKTIGDWIDYFDDLPKDIQKDLALIGERNNKDTIEISKEYFKVFNFNFKVRKADADKKHALALTELSKKYVEHTKHKSKNFLLDIMDNKDDTKIKIIDSLSGLLEDKIFYHTVFLSKQGKYTPVICTSNGDVLEVLNDDEYQFFNYGDITYKFRSFLHFSDRYKINTVNNDVIDDVINKKQYTKNIFDDVKNQIKNYYFYPYDYEYDVLTAYNIMTFIYEILGRTIYLPYLGSKGTGKSTAMATMSYLQYNGRCSGKGTLAVNCRYIDLYGISLGQDEFEKMDKKEKLAFVGIFNSGFTKLTGYYSLVNQHEKKIANQIVNLKTFCPKSFTCNDLKGFDLSFIDRCYIVKSIKTNRHTKDILQLTNEDLQIFQGLYNTEFIYCLFNWKEIIKCVNDKKIELEKDGVFGRETDKNSIILGIISHFKGDDYSKKVKQYISEKAPLEVEEHTLTMEEIILKTIVKRYTGEPLITIENEELYLNLWQKLGFTSPDDRYAPSNQKPRKILDNLGLINKKENLGYIAGGKRKYHINVEELKSVLKSGGYEKLLENIDFNVP